MKIIACKLSLAIVLLGLVFGNIAAGLEKIIEPPIAPQLLPSLETGEARIIIANPTHLPTAEANFPPKNGLYNWGKEGEISALYLSHNTHVFSKLGAISLYGSLFFEDPYSLGGELGLAEDALRYRVGGGFACGNYGRDASFFSIPLYAGADLFFNEGSFYGNTPFLGIGANLNLINNKLEFGGVGYGFYGGILVNLGFEDKSEISIGHQFLNIGGGKIIDTVGFSFSQPLKF